MMNSKKLRRDNTKQTWKTRLKRISGIRSAKRRVWSASRTLLGGIHRLLGFLLPQSKVWGSPRHFEASFQTAIENSDRHTSGKTQEYIPLMRDSILVKASRLVMGEVPQDYLNKNETLEVKEFIAVLRPARIYTKDAAVIERKDALIGEASIWYGTGRHHPAFKTLFLPKIHYLNGRGLYLRGAHNYFHFLTDIVPSVHLLEMANLDIKDFDYILMKPPQTQFELELAHLFEIPTNKIVSLYDYEHIEVKDLTIPTIHNRHGTWFVQYIRGKLLNKSTEMPHTGRRRHLYVTRKSAQTRRIINEDKVFFLLQSYGFELVELETLSVLEQARLFQSAEIIVGPHGAGLTNLLFSPPGAKLLEIRSKQQNSETNDCFQRLCAFAEVEHYLLFGEGTSTNPIAEGYEMDIVVNIDVLQHELDLLILG